jgi:hypothetical protein
VGVAAKVETFEKVFIVNFAAGLWVHSSMESRLASDLSGKGFEVAFLSCDGLFDGKCAVRSARKSSSLKIEKKLDCRDCKFTSKMMASSLNGAIQQTEWLGSRVSELDRDHARRIAQSAMELIEPLDLEIDGVRLASIASYEVILAHKILDGKFTGEAASELKDAIRNCYLTGLAVRRLFSENKGPLTVVVRNPQYATHHIVALEAARAGHRVLYLDGSYNISETYSHAAIWDWRKFGIVNPARDEFKTTKERFLVPASRVERIENHSRSLRAATSHRVYSAPETRSLTAVRSKLNIEPGSKTVLLALNSTDEVLASRSIGSLTEERFPGRVFESQIHWVRETISWAEVRPELNLIIRVHPREFPNSRSNLRSEMANVWEDLLSELPANVKLNHPDQNISVYDLLSTVSVVSTGWSSVGLEAALQGLPIVLYDSGLPGFPSEIGRSGLTPSDYFRNLTAALEEKPDKERTRQRSLFWLDLQMNLGTFKVGGRLLESQRYKFPRWLTLVFEGVDRYFYLVYRPLDLVLGRARKSETEKILPLMTGEKHSLFN